MKKIILASQSPRRAELLKEHGYHFRIVPADCDEAEYHRRPSALVCHNAALKARKVAERYPHDWVLGADTVIYFEGSIIGKPKTRTHAARILGKLQGKKHWVYTGVCLVHVAGKICHTFFDKTQMRFKKLTQKEILAYHAHVNPMDKSGAYAVNEHGDKILMGYRGSFSNIVGLPMEKLAVAFKRLSRLAIVLGAVLLIQGVHVPGVQAKALDREDLKGQIADHEVERGWSALNQVLQEANQGEKNPAVRAANRRVVDELVGRSSSSREKTYLVTNYNNRLKNRLGGKDYVGLTPEGKTLPWIKMDLVFGQQQKANKTARIDFNAAYGKVWYGMSFKRGNVIARNNALRFSIKSTVPRLRFQLLVGDEAKQFEYQGLKDTWQVIALPFSVFNDFAPEEAKAIKGFEILVDGDEIPEEYLEGAFFLEDFQLANYREKDLAAAHEEAMKHLYQPGASFITEMYQEREHF